MTGPINPDGETLAADEALIAQCDELEEAVDRHFELSPTIRIKLDVSSWEEATIASCLRSGTVEEQVAILEQVKIHRLNPIRTVWRRLAEIWQPHDARITVTCAGVPVAHGGELVAVIRDLSFEHRPIVQPIALLLWSQIVNYDFDRTTVLQLCEQALTTRLYEVRCFSIELLMLYERKGVARIGPELMEHGFSPLVHSRRTAERIRQRVKEHKT